MLNDINLRLSHLLIQWYEKNKRDLPWRHTQDPYKIWLSEIILQQTRVIQGYDYYVKFVTNYPSVGHLAAASEDEVLKLWQGLGYYSRARNLLEAAKTIVHDFDSKFPTQYEDILCLKGVGEYTAAAITSFAYGQAYAVVDGNVYRVLSRVFGVEDPIDTGQGKKLFKALAQSLLDVNNASIHNQAIMEFGALQCVPVSPDCSSCPVSDMCIAYNEKRITDLPKKEGKTKTRDRYLNYFEIEWGDNIYLQKREEDDVWKNLYELPLIETQSKEMIDGLIPHPAFQNIFADNHIDNITHIADMKHILSHQIIYASFYRVVVNSSLASLFLEIKRDDVETYAISRLIEKYFERVDK